MCNPICADLAQIAIKKNKHKLGNSLNSLKTIILPLIVNKSNIRNKYIYNPQAIKKDKSPTLFINIAFKAAFNACNRVD